MYEIVYVLDLFPKINTKSSKNNIVLLYSCNFKSYIRLYKTNFRQKFVKISDCKAFSLFNDEKESDHEGTRTLNLPIRSRTPYPLGHAASHKKVSNTLHSRENSSNALVNIYVR